MLFQEQKYPVVVGNEHASVGFCTVWNKIESALTAAPDLKDKSAIIGTLYSRQGVNPLLRNLALNPHIRTLALWGYGPLSQTPFGKSGADILRALWKNGLEENGRVAGTEFDIESEIDPEVVETVRKNVALLDLSECDIRDASGKLPTDIGEAYMEPRAFDPPVPRPVATLPHEDVGFTLRGRTVLETWQELVFHIMRYGVVKGTQYGMEQRELPSVQWVVEREPNSFPEHIPEDWPQGLKETVGLTEAAIKEYHDVFLSEAPKEGVAYTYGSRLRSWKTDDGMGAVNQIATAIIDNLKQSPDSRRAAATTLVPSIDATAKEPPCLISVQALQSDGRVHLFCMFRSHDIFKAAIPNAFGLLRMHDEIAEATGFERGSLSIVSNSAHIYEGDFAHAEKLIACSHIEREPRRVWNAVDADPRGSFLIRLDDGEIVAEHQGPNGAVLGEYRGRTAKDVSLKISQLCLISQVGHALDVGHELQKAEHALKLGLRYVQDPPLDFSRMAWQPVATGHSPLG